MNAIAAKRYVKSVTPLYNFLRFCRGAMRWFYQPFVYGKLAYEKNLEKQQQLHGKYDLNTAVNEMLRQKKYEQVCDYIPEGAKILDIASGAGELHQILKLKGKNVEYVGLDYDSDRVEIAREHGIDVRKFDCNDVVGLEKFIDENGPFDCILCIYAFYFFKQPEQFLNMLRGKCDNIMLGCFNGGHIQNRIRVLFGRSVCPSVFYYPEKETNFSEWERMWTYKDYKYIFKELGYRKSKLIAAKSDCTSIHYSPRRFILPSWFSMAFIFQVS